MPSLATFIQILLSHRVPLLVAHSWHLCNTNDLSDSSASTHNLTNVSTTDSVCRHADRITAFILTAPPIKAKRRRRATVDESLPPTDGRDLFVPKPQGIWPVRPSL
jgi:hypothetical protein